MEKHIVKDQKRGQVDVYLLWRVLQGNLTKIVVAAVVLAAALGLYRYTNSVPSYSTEVKFLICPVTVERDKDTNEITNVYTYMGSNASAYGTNIAYNAPYIIMEDRAQDTFVSYMQDTYPDKYDNLNRRSVLGMLGVKVDNQIVTVTVSGINKQQVLDLSKTIETKVPACMDYYFGVVNTEGVENIASVAKSISSVTEQDLALKGRGVTKYTALGFVIGAAILYIFSLLRTYFDNTIYTEDDIKHRFTIPVIGQIPTWENTKVTNTAFKDKSRKDHIKGSKEKNSPDGGNLMSDRDYEGRLLGKRTPFAITEAFKLLRTNMCYTTKGETCPVYGITSAYVSAGKSLIAANMAVSFAQMGKRVLLVDADLRCPVQHDVFKLKNEDGVLGLSDLLAGICNLEDIYERNGGFENLNVIASGKIPPNPAELLASSRMKDFIARVKESYDVVFIDLPPVCEVSDAGIISDLVTGYAFVVRAGYSDRRMIELAVETMEGFDASFVGLILNDIDIKSGDYYKNKYYSNYGKYRFRYGKQGYYRSYKYGYYSRYGYTRYSRNNYESGYENSRYNTSYKNVTESYVDDDDTATNVGGFGAGEDSRADSSAGKVGGSNAHGEVTADKPFRKKDSQSGETDL